MLGEIPPGFDKGMDLSLGYNAKVHSSIPIWNLPRLKTCPGSTSACRGYCYATDAENRRAGVKASRERNLRYSMRDDFVVRMNTLLKAYAPRFVRIHESGDFYNEAYLEKWKEIARLNSDTRFLAFTRSPFIFKNIASVPSNLVLIYSIDDTTKAHSPSGFPVAYCGKSNKGNYRECPKNNDPHAACTPVAGRDMRHRGIGDKKVKPVFSQACMACWYGGSVYLKER